LNSPSSLRIMHDAMQLEGEDENEDFDIVMSQSCCQREALIGSTMKDDPPHPESL
jgi:hypothetical protein